MPPATAQSHQPLLLYSLSYGLPMTMGHKRSLHTMRTPRSWEFQKADPGNKPVGMPVFRVLRRAVRCLRATLSQIMEHCRAVMEVLRSAASPALAGKDLVRGLLEEMGGLRPGGGARDPGRQPADQEWNCTTDLKVLDEEGVLAADVMNMEDDHSPGEEGELDLSDWLDWESEEESPRTRPVPSDHSPELILLGPCERSVVFLGLNAEGEQEEEEQSASDWSDDDDDDDDDDWDESDDSSEVDSALWESFLCGNDPFNPFRLSPPAGKTASVPQTGELSAVRHLHVIEGEGEREEVDGEKERDHPPQPGKKAGKKVRFSEEVKVHPLVDWADASRAARDGSCWLEMARDRDRFRRRVQAASDIISPFLQANHRARVWERIKLT